MSQEHAGTGDAIRSALNRVADKAPVSADSWNRIVERANVRRRSPLRAVAVLFALVAGLVGFALLGPDGDVGTVVVQDEHEPIVLRPLPPYQKPPVPDGYTPRTVEGVWRLEWVDGDDRTLAIRVFTTGCLSFDHMTLEKADEASLYLRAWNEHLEPDEGYGCSVPGGMRRYRVEVPQPIAGRTVEGQCEVVGDGADSESRACQTLLSSIEAHRGDGSSDQ